MKEIVLLSIIILTWFPSVALWVKVTNGEKISNFLHGLALISIAVNCAMAGVFWMIVYSGGICKI